MAMVLRYLLTATLVSAFVWLALVLPLEVHEGFRELPKGGLHLVVFSGPLTALLFAGVNAIFSLIRARRERIKKLRYHRTLVALMTGTVTANAFTGTVIKVSTADIPEAFSFTIPQIADSFNIGATVLMVILAVLDYLANRSAASVGVLLLLAVPAVWPLLHVAAEALYRRLVETLSPGVSECQLAFAG